MVDWAYDTGAICSFLSSDVNVAALVGVTAFATPRIYGEEIPDSEAKFMPRKCIIVNSIGRGFRKSMHDDEMPIDERLKDIRCYAENPYEAMKLWSVMNEAFKLMRRQLHTPPGGDGLKPVLLYSVSRVGGPTTLREPETFWPLVFGTYSVMAADTV